MRVRLTPDEHAAWSAARAVTGRRELGTWLRVTVNELLSLPSGERLDRPEPVPPIVDAQTYLTLVSTGPAAPVIAVIRKGSDFGHAAQYLFRPGAGGPSTSNGG